MHSSPGLRRIPDAPSTIASVRVALSMLTLVPGVSGGSETYARGLARALAARGLVDVTAYVPPAAPGAGEGLPTEVVDEWGAASSSAARLFAVARATAAPRRLRRRFDSIDVVHYPLTVPVPRVGARSIVTLHDVQHLDLPELFPRSTRTYRRFMYDRAARAADLVVVPSDFVRERSLERLGLDPARVRAIPLGVDLARFSPGPATREPFLLYPARPWPHKNHERLLEAFALLRSARPDLRLVLTGVGAERFAGRPGVEARGGVSSEELVDLSRRAACLVFPSRYEGFGSPPLEAMACGTPVAAARAGSIPEVCGDAAVLFDPDDAAAIAVGVEEALLRADELREPGLARVAGFTWERTAVAHEDAYRAVAA
jgi:glycosyltransferase involved in cell wall biosynthesis